MMFTNKLPDEAFAIPEERKWPVHTLAHARRAVALIGAIESERNRLGIGPLPPEQEAIKQRVLKRAQAIIDGEEIPYVDRAKS